MLYIMHIDIINNNILDKRSCTFIGIKINSVLYRFGADDAEKLEQKNWHARFMHRIGAPTAPIF